MTELPEDLTGIRFLNNPNYSSKGAQKCVIDGPSVGGNGWKGRNLDADFEFNLPDGGLRNCLEGGTFQITHIPEKQTDPMDKNGDLKSETIVI